MVAWRSIFLGPLCCFTLYGAALGKDKPSGGGKSDWGVVERERGSDDTTVVRDEDEKAADETPVAERKGDASAAEPFGEEKLDYSPIVESVTKQTVEKLGRKLVGGEGHVCLRCEEKNQLSVQVLGVKTLVGVTGIEMTRHVMSRTSVRGGVGYGIGGVTLGAAMLHYFLEDSWLHLLTGINVSIKGKRHFEGLWVLIGVGSNFSTQVGITYGAEFGMTMAALESVFGSNARLCFGVLSQSSCRERWRILPYITPLKIGFTF